MSIIKEFSQLPSFTIAKAVLQEISQTVISSVSSAGSIKMSLWPEKQKINPRPSISKDHLDWM